jgi:hypothetical protein
MSPRKKKESALRSYTQESLDKSLKEAATKKESKVKKKKKTKTPKIKVKAGLGRDPESDEEWLGNLEETYKKLRDRKAHTALITMSQFNFLLEMARE